MTFTPTLNRSGQQPMRVEKSPNGVYSVKNVYSGDYEYFQDGSQPKPKEAATTSNSK